MEHVGSLRAQSQLRGECCCPVSIPSVGVGNLEVPRGDRGPCIRKQFGLE